MSKKYLQESSVGMAVMDALPVLFFLWNNCAAGKYLEIAAVLRRRNLQYRCRSREGALEADFGNYKEKYPVFK